MATSARSTLSGLVALLLASLCPLSCSAAVRPAPICSGPPINIIVRNENAIYLRLKYPPRRLVTLTLVANIRLSKTLIFTSNFSCTQFLSSRIRAFTLSGPNATSPVLQIVNTDNVLVHGINFNLPISSANMPPCQYPPYSNIYNVFLDHWHCPSVWIYGSYAVQIAKGNTFGRVDVIISNYSRVDSMQILVHKDNFPGAIWVGGTPTTKGLYRSNVFITNNYLRTQTGPTGGAANGLFLARGAVGVNVYNNNIANFSFNGIQFGFGEKNVGDAMLNQVFYNDIGFAFGNTGDNTGIYADTHWVSPGNVLRCNYVRNGGHCLYLDYLSSGFTVDGLVCIRTTDGVKMNAGKNNVIKGYLAVQMGGTLGYISCQNYATNNCGLANIAGSKQQIWVSWLYWYWQTPLVIAKYPYLFNFCNKTSINGVNCNANTTAQYSAKVTGNCSGLPTENYVEVVSARTDNVTGEFHFTGDSCGPFSSVPKLNSFKIFNTKIAQGGFIQPIRGDYGLTRFSRIHRAFPQFRSCPYTAVGPMPVNFTSYARLFNFRQPREAPLIYFRL